MMYGFIRHRPRVPVFMPLLLVAALILPTAGVALEGQGTSASGTLDSRPPVVSIDLPAGGEVFHGTEAETLLWTIDEDLFDAVPLPVSVRILDGGTELWSELISPEAGGSYSYVWPVTDVNASDARLIVLAVDHFGWSTADTSEVFSIENSLTPVAGPQLPHRNRLDQNYPNPFNPSTSLRYALQEAAEVELAVYDLGGRRVTVLAQGAKPAGVHAAIWHGTDVHGRAVPSGVYLARLRIQGQAGVETLVRRLTMLK